MVIAAMITEFYSVVVWCWIPRCLFGSSLQFPTLLTPFLFLGCPRPIPQPIIFADYIFKFRLTSLCPSFAARPTPTSSHLPIDQSRFINITVFYRFIAWQWTELHQIFDSQPSHTRPMKSISDFYIFAFFCGFQKPFSAPRSVRSSSRCHSR